MMTPRIRVTVALIRALLVEASGRKREPLGLEPLWKASSTPQEPEGPRASATRDTSERFRSLRECVLQSAGCSPHHQPHPAPPSELAVALQQRAAASAQPPGVAPEAAEDRHVALSEHRLAQADGVPPADILALLLGLPITRLPVTRPRRPTRMPVMRAVSRTLDARPFVGMPRARRRYCGERKQHNETQE